MTLKSRISPCLWFDGQAEQAATFYTGVFPNSKINAISHYGEAGREIHGRSEEHTSELQSLMRISYAVFCLNKKKILYKKVDLILITYNDTTTQHQTSTHIL